MGASLSGRQPKAVVTALEVLEKVATSGTGVTAKEIAYSLGLPPATTYRLLNILVAEGYLVRLADLTGFALGQRMGRLLGPTRPTTVCHAAHQLVTQLRRDIRFAICLVCYYPPTTVQVVDADPDHALQADDAWVRHLHASAVGKLLLSDQGDWRDIFPEHRLVAITAHTITSPAALDSQIVEFRERGVAHQVGELRSTTACYAVPVRSVSGALVGALAISGPRERQEALAERVQPMRYCADQLGPLLA
jgi:DNA-binding IclR family transcriptional regulator